MVIKTSWVLMSCLGAVALLAGCGKQEEAPVEGRPYARMHDPTYLGMLKTQRDEQQTLMRQLDTVRKAYAAELAKDTNSPKVAVLKQQLDELAAAVIRNRKVSQEIVRQRIEMEQRAIGAKAVKNVEKKGN